MECRLHRHALQRAFRLQGFLEEQVKVLEPGVCGSLPTGDDLSADSQEHDVMQLQRGQSGGVAVPGGDVLGPQGKAGGAAVRGPLVLHLVVQGLEGGGAHHHYALRRGHVEVAVNDKPPGRLGGLQLHGW